MPLLNSCSLCLLQRLSWLCPLPDCMALTVIPGRSKPVEDPNVPGFYDLPLTFTTSHVSSCCKSTNPPFGSLECQSKTHCCVPLVETFLPWELRPLSQQTLTYHLQEWEENFCEWVVRINGERSSFCHLFFTPK